MFLIISEHLGHLLWMVLFEIQQSFALLLYCSLWARHGGHSSGFLHGIAFATFRLAGPAWVIDISEPFRDHASLKTRFAGFFRAVLKWGRCGVEGGGGSAYRQMSGKC